MCSSGVNFTTFFILKQSPPHIQRQVCDTKQIGIGLQKVHGESRSRIPTKAEPQVRARTGSRTCTRGPPRPPGPRAPPVPCPGGPSSAWRAAPAGRNTGKSSPHTPALPRFRLLKVFFFFLFFSFIFVLFFFFSPSFSFPFSFFPSSFPFS